METTTPTPQIPAGTEGCWFGPAGHTPGASIRVVNDVWEATTFSRITVLFIETGITRDVSYANTDL